MGQNSIVAAFVFFAATNASAQWIVGIKRPPSGPGFSTRGAEVLFARPHETEGAPTEPKLLSRMPFFLPEGAPASVEMYEEWILPESSVTPELKSIARVNAASVVGELRTLVEQGPPRNRICLTIIGDGYTQAERDKFFADAERTRRGLFESDTFASFRGLFNVYAVFVASRESGITDGVRKDTAFGLRRDPPGSKRAIMPGNTRALEAAIALAPKTDYPIVLANDEFYGGLGGRYAISTSSIRSGEVVLRHELGHNFGQVGEEYDNGYVYSGANSTQIPESPEWRHWIVGRPKIHEMQLLSGNYVWKNLSTGPVRARFTMPRPDSRGSKWFDGVISFVGWSSPGEVEVLLDGQPVRLAGEYTVDRGFLKILPDRSLAAGAHSLEVRELVHDGDNVLAFATLFSYASDYDFSPTVGAHTTYDSDGRISYRPTHDDCLMRDMTKRHFCSVDQENIWAKLLSRLTLIDAVDATTASATVRTFDVASLEITWMGPQGEITRAKNQRTLAGPLEPGEYRVRVKVETPEVRREFGALSAERSFRVLATEQR